jgi:hypothetical protein
LDVLRRVPSTDLLLAVQPNTNVRVREADYLARQAACDHAVAAVDAS